MFASNCILTVLGMAKGGDVEEECHLFFASFHFSLLCMVAFWELSGRGTIGVSAPPPVLQEIDLPGFMQPFRVGENELPFPRLSKSEK